MIIIKKRIIVSLLFILGILFLSGIIFIKSHATKSNKVIRIYIDPGHGGFDGGCEKPNYANHQQAYAQQQCYGPKILIHTITRLLS